MRYERRLSYLPSGPSGSSLSSPVPLPPCPGSSSSPLKPLFLGWCFFYFSLPMAAAFPWARAFSCWLISLALAFPHCLPAAATISPVPRVPLPLPSLRLPSPQCLCGLRLHSVCCVRGCCACLFCCIVSSEGGGPGR